MDIKNLKQIIEQELQAMVPDADDEQNARDLFTGTFEPIRLADIEDRTYSPDEVRQMGYETLGGITDSPFVKVKTKTPMDLKVLHINLASDHAINATMI